MNSEQTGSKAGGQGRGARAITRGEEARVREALAPIFMGDGDRPVLQYDGDRLTMIAGEHYSAGFVATRNEIAARAGIVPGPEGWCWVAAPVAPGDLFRSCRSGNVRRAVALETRGLPRPVWRMVKVGDDLNVVWVSPADLADPAQWERPGAECVEGQGKGAPPAWLTADVLAALPGDGTPVGLATVAAAVRRAWAVRIAPAFAQDCGEHELAKAALAHLVGTGEIEATPEQWRRWGVPEGWGWRERDGWVGLYRVGADESYQIASVHTDGGWTAFQSEQSTRTAAEGTAKPPTLAAARSAALRACYERGVFTEAAPSAALPKPVPSPSPAPTAEDRPARLRAALLAVLTPGPIRTGAALLPALDAAMGERAGVAVATGAEARQAAREVGARVDGVEWSLPPVPDGWGWHRPIASRWYLAPLDASDPEREAVASLTVDDGVGGIGGLMWRVKGEMWQGCASVEEGQSAALQAARLAGLFAAPRAEAAPVATTAPMAPLDALARRLCGAHLYAAGSPGMAAVEADVAALTPLLAAFRADVVTAAKREDSGAADPLHHAALAVSAARRALRAADPGSGEWSAAEIEVARTTGALLDALGIDAEEVAGDARHAQRIAENERDAALARAGIDAADRATLDAVGRLREALTALCAGPGGWRWKVDESAPDAAVRLIGVMASRIADFETVQRVADAHRQEMRASRDAALAELTRVREGIAAVMGAIAGGREAGK